MIAAFAVCSISAFAVLASGCNMTENIKKKIEQSRCEHEFDAGEVTKEATCAKVGERVKTCVHCGLQETEEVTILPHTVVILKEQSPTCTKPGLTEGEQCSVCKTILKEQKVIAALGHKLVKDEAVESTCTQTGLTEGSSCERCDYVAVAQKETALKEHVMSVQGAYDATCEAVGFTGGVKCDNCDYATEGEILPALEHVYGEWTETKAATCTQDGEKTRTCTREGCDGANKTQVQVLPALGHVYSNWETVKAPTCTETGEEKRTCVHDGCELFETRAVSALGHSENEGQVTVIATCYSEGEKSYTCATCGNVRKEVIPMIAHTYGEWQVTPATCTENGENKRSCTAEGCTHEEVQAVSPTGHTYQDGVCTVCGEDESEAVELIYFVIDGITYKAEKGMTWSEWISSRYNVDNFSIEGNCIVLAGNEVQYTQGDYVKLDDKISVYAYSLDESCCFVAGTPVLMADGSTKAIENIIIGDEVLTWNEEKKAYDTGVVVGLIVKEETYDMARVTFADGTSIEMNAYHPIYTQEGWKSLTGYNDLPILQVGDKALSTNGEFDEIVSIIRWTAEEPIKTYNLSVEDEHNYFVGETSVLAHNNSSAC